MDLTKVNGCYSKELYKNLEDLKEDYSDVYTSTDYMRQRVLDIIAPARDTEAKKRFIGNLLACHSKRTIYNLCCSAVNNAMNYKL